MKDPVTLMTKEKVAAYMDCHLMGVTTKEIASDFAVPREEAAKRMSELGYTKKAVTALDSIEKGFNGQFYTTNKKIEVWQS